MTKNKKMKQSSKKAIEIGAGAVAAAALAAAAASYFLSGENGAKRKAKMKAWAVKARHEVGKNIQVAKRLSAAEYAHIVDQAVKRYGAMEDVTAGEVLKVAKDLKAEWKRIQSQAKKVPIVKKAKSAARKKSSKRSKARAK